MFRPSLRRKLLLAGASLFVCSVAPQKSAASINHWINPLGGSWSDPANWRQGRVPLADDRCLFDLDASYTVQLTHNALVADAEFMRGEVTLNLSGQTFTLESELADRLLVGAAAGQNARLTVSGGGTLFTPLHFSAAQDAAARAVTLGFARIGTGAGSFGRLELNGANTAMPLTGGITLGRPDGSGSGELLIRNGAVVSDTIAGGGLAARIELNPGSSVYVSGSNSRLIVRDFYSTGGALPAAARNGTDASTISITAGASAKAAVWSLGPHTVLNVSDGGRLFNEDGLAAPDLRIGANAAATLRGLVNIGSASINAGTLDLISALGVSVDRLEVIGGAQVLAGRAIIGSGSIGGGSTFSGSLYQSNLTVRDGATALLNNIDASTVLISGLGTGMSGMFLTSGAAEDPQPQLLRLEDAARATYQWIHLLGNTRLELAQGARVTTQELSIAGRSGAASVVAIDGSSSVSSELVMVSGAVPGAGRLILDAGGTITADDRVIIGAGGVLSGSGSVSGRLDVQAGGSIQPGEQTDGTIVTGDLELGGTLVYDITGNPAADLLEVHGGVLIAPGSELRLRLAGGIEPPAGSIFLIIRNDGDDAVNGAFSEVSIVDRSSTILPSPALDYIVDYRYVADPDGLPNDVAVRVVPEPHAMTLAMLLAGLTSCRPQGNGSGQAKKRARVLPAACSCRCGTCGC